jgi:hypothetical protein
MELGLERTMPEEMAAARPFKGFSLRIPMNRCTSFLLLPDWPVVRGKGSEGDRKGYTGQGRNEG